MHRSTTLSCLGAAGALCCAAQGAFGATEGGGNFFGDLGHAIAAVVVFLLLLAVLGKWAWKPIVGQLRKREEGIAAALRDSEQRRAEAMELLSRYQAQLEQVQAQAKELLATARREAAQAREQVLAAARDEAHRTVERSAQEIDHARQQALRELYDQTARMAADIAAQLLPRELTPQDHQRLMQQSLDEIRQRSEVGK
jgi:F-type H+-transporting ATPase subunit b